MLRSQRSLVSFSLVVFLLAASLVFLLQSFHPQIAHAAVYTVLFDDNHAETAGNADWVISSSIPDPLQQNANPQSETDWTGGISAWGVALQKTGRYSLKTNNSALTYGNSSNPLDLTNFRELVLPEPNTLFTSSEKTAIMRFVKNGGGLFMIADHTGSDRNNDGSDSLQILNDLMSNSGSGSDPFGIKFDSLNIATENPSNDTPNASSDPLLNGPFGSATGSIIRNGTTETLNASDNANVKGVIYRSGYSNTGTTGVFVSRSTYGSGRVIAEGDSSAIDDGTCQSSNTCYNGWNDTAGQNYALFPNGTEWLAGGGAGSSTPTAVATSSPTSTPISTPSQTPGAGGNMISNGGFENGTSPWVGSSSGGYAIVDTTKPHAGSYSAYLCGYNNCSDSVYQQVTIASSVTTATLTYYWYMSTQETTHAYDYLYVRIRSSSGSTLATLQTLSDGSTANSWQQGSFNVSSYKGQTVQIAFVATNGAKNPTDFYVDDVALNAQ